MRSKSFAWPITSAGAKYPGAPAPLAFAYGKARSRKVVTVHAEAPTERPPRELETRPYRMRPKVMARDATGAAGGDSKGHVLARTRAKRLERFSRSCAMWASSRLLPEPARHSKTLLSSASGLTRGALIRATLRYAAGVSPNLILNARPK